MPTCPLHWTMPTCLLHWTTFSGLLRLVSEGLRPPQANVSAALGHIQELRTRRAAAAAEARVPPLRARVGGDGGDAPRARRARPRDPLLVADCWSEESPSSPRNSLQLPAACPKAAPAVAVPLRNSRPMSALGPAPRPLPPVAVPPSRHMSLTHVRLALLTAFSRLAGRRWSRCSRPTRRCYAAAGTTGTRRTASATGAGRPAGRRRWRSRR